MFYGLGVLERGGWSAKQEGLLGWDDGCVERLVRIYPNCCERERYMVRDDLKDERYTYVPCLSAAVGK